MARTPCRSATSCTEAPATRPSATIRRRRCAVHLPRRRGTTGPALTDSRGSVILHSRGHGRTLTAVFEFAVMSAVLGILGPGAISMDARLFGRREVAIREARDWNYS